VVEENCPGTAATPAAAAGYLCAYVAAESGTVTNFIFEFLNMLSATEYGAALPLETTAAQGFAYGTWAVTAE
jgi:hypothetical protein